MNLNWFYKLMFWLTVLWKENKAMSYNGAQLSIMAVYTLMFIFVGPVDFHRNYLYI
jgi:hypothetical protein